MSKQLLLPERKWKISKVNNDISNIKEGLPKLVDAYSVCAYTGFNGKFPWFVVRVPALNYRKFFIDKDTGVVMNEPIEGLRLREINAPVPRLKELQKRLASCIFNKLPKHTANYAYMRGRTTKDACEQHNENDVSIIIDLKDFFDSHRAAYIRRKLHSVTGYNSEVCWFISKLVTLNNKMPQGSPASPSLSIALNYNIDEKLTALATAKGLTYTRYADDMHFSGADRSNTACWSFIEEIRNVLEGFRINWKKVRILRSNAKLKIIGWEIPGDISESPFASDIPEDFALKVTNGTSKVRLINPITSKKLCDFKELSAAVEGLKAAGLIIKPIKWYTHSVREMLGLHLLHGANGVKFPGRRFKKLRVEAMLYGSNSHPNPTKFVGLLAYISKVDNHKYLKLQEVVEKYRRKQGR